MKLILGKQIEEDGEVWYFVKKNEESKKFFNNENRAMDYYNNLKQGSTKTEEIILSEEIPDQKQGDGDNLKF